ncbi:UTP--glucose-1-phosphate uridylyltransferase GalU [Orrella sp. 11846]|uniref:UTP--glucose-1-phosphate uridylyltransferase GalU n=1 Tax=Orrella sp. 11846 TaxID=3409913 RepID=UPI003B5AC410
MRPIRKAVFPVAGLGTRFLPATKAMPKEMLPVVDKPLIQYAVEEAIAAGITDLIFVTGRHKRSIEDHFDTAPELERELQEKCKDDLLEALTKIINPDINCIYIRQSAPLGLGHAVLCAQPAVGDEPFAVILADDLIDAQRPVLSQLIDVALNHQASVLAVQNVAREDTNKYGIVSSESINAKTSRVHGIVEKPHPDQAPSTLGVVGRYVLDNTVFQYLRQIQAGSGGEIQLTDGIAAMLADHPIIAHQYDGVRYDCGSKLGMFQANVAYGKKYHGFTVD